MTGPYRTPSSAASLTPRRVPEAYVRAEVAVAPLTSPSAFESVLVELDPDVADPQVEQPGATARLWRECEGRLVEHTGGWSLDRLVAIRDKTWFHDPRETRPVPMHRFLRRLAAAHVEAWSGTTEVRRDTEEHELDAINHYRWLGFAIPEDLLLSASPVKPPPRQLDLEPPLLKRRLLDLGVAEIHQHGGAGMDFPHLWGSALRALADPELPENALMSPGAPFDDGRKLLHWLLVAAITRYVLGVFLIHAAEDPMSKTLEDFLRGRFARGRYECHALLSLGAVLRALVRHPFGEPPEFARLQFLYRELHPTASEASERPGTLEAFWRCCDPLSTRIGLTEPNAGERWLIRHALAYLERKESPLHARSAAHRESRHGDRLFAEAFWQVLRIRCQYYRFIVQRPLTAGLQWFIRFSDRIWGLRKPLDPLRPELAFRVAHVEGIAALELRSTIDQTAIGLAESLRATTASFVHVLEQHRGARTPEFGLVLLFAKTRDLPNTQGNWSGGTPSAFWRFTQAHPSGSIAGERYARFLDSQSPRAHAVAHLLRAVPLALHLVRGVDVASDELGVPTWVLVPLFGFLFHESRYASALPHARRAPPLRATAHVGEDYRHLMEGLRRIYEAQHYVLGSSGGRLGHATALGMEPRRWAESVGSVLMPAEERLWDLVFEWRMYSGYEVPPEFRASAPPGREQRLAILIRDLADHIFGTHFGAAVDAVGRHDDLHHAVRTAGGRDPFEPSELAKVHHGLHRFLLPKPASDRERTSSIADTDLADILHALLRSPTSRDTWYTPCVRLMLHAHLCDPEVFRRGQELVDVTLDNAEVEAIAAVQDALRRGIGARGIVVEINPTSNLLIGDLLDLRHHPILRLFPPEPEPGVMPVPIAVGSDDPITFDTSLLREYALLHQAARAAGYSERTAQDWLEAIRRTGMDCRYTLPWGPDPRQMAGMLLEAFDRYLERPARRPQVRPCAPVAIEGTHWPRIR